MLPMKRVRSVNLKPGFVVMGATRWSDFHKCFYVYTYFDDVSEDTAIFSVLTNPRRIHQNTVIRNSHLYEILSAEHGKIRLWHNATLVWLDAT